MVDDADPSVSSPQITLVTAAAAQRVAGYDPAVAGHPWLERATRYGLTAIDAIHEAPFAYVLAFSLRFLDAVHEIRPEAPALLRRLGAFIPANGLIPVTGGTENEMLRPLDIAPYPDRPVRDLFAADVISADLERLAGEQQEDGGWTVDFLKISPAGSLEWRGFVTARAIDILRRNGMV